MSSDEELVKAVTEALDQKGVLNILKARTRAEVLSVLSDNQPQDKVKPPQMPDDIILVNELIREYFKWIGYDSTNSMFITEAGMGDAPMTRPVLLRELNVKDKENTDQLPVLLSLVSTFKNIPSMWT